MATRLFFHDVANALSGTFPTGAQSSVLTATKSVSGSDVLLTMSSITGAAQVARSLSGSQTIAAQSLFCGFFCSDTFDVDQPVGGGNQVITLNIGNRQSSLNMNLGSDLRTSVYVWRPSTGTVVGYVNDGGAMTGDAEPSSAVANRVNNASVTSTTTVSAQAGDVLICEIWQNFTQASGLAFSGAIFYDGAIVNTTTNATISSHASFLNFSVSTLTFGTPPVNSISCSFGQTLSAMTLAGVGSSPRNGSFNGTLAALTLAGEGSIPLAGTFSNTLAAATLSGTGQVGVANGTFSNTLAAATLSGVGSSPRNGTFNNTLAALTLSGAAAVPLVGTFSNTLGNATLTATAGASLPEIDGSFNNTLAALALAGEGSIPLAGTFSNTLAAATLSADGTVTDIAPAVGSFLVTLDNAQLAAAATVLRPTPTRTPQDPGAGSGASRVRKKFRVPDVVVAPNPIDAILEPLQAPLQSQPAPKVATMSMVTHLTVAPTPLPVPFVRLPVIEEDEYSDDDMIMIAMLV